MTSFRERRIQLLQQKALDAMTARLTSVTVLRTLQWHDIPEWVLASMAAVRRTDALPDSVLPLEADDVEQWVRGFLVESGIGDQFYLTTGIERFPWLEVVATDPSWLDSLGRLPVVLSGDRMTLAVVYEEEYRYEAFRRFMAPPSGR